MNHFLLVAAIVAGIVTWIVKWYQFWDKKLSYKDDAVVCTFATTIATVIFCALVSVIWTATA